VLRYIEANPLRARLVGRGEEYPWSSYRVHGLGEVDELVDPLITYDEISPYPKIRQRKWAEKVHRPLPEEALARIRRSTSAGLPYGDDAWVKRLVKKLSLDLTIRPRGRPRKEVRPTK
jgi:putative transposase